MSRTALVTGYTWIDSRPALRIRTRGSRRVTDLPIRGQVRFRVTGKRLCIGHVTGQGLAPCPDGAAPIRYQCAACERRDVFRPCMTCNGFRCPPLSASMRRYCQRDHHLYLACFGDSDTLKVGTASHGRRDQRVIEQGPLAAARVAQGPGPRIKQVEHLLVADEDFVEAMRRDRKTRLLGGGMTADEGRTRVLEAAQTLRMRLSLEYHSLLHPPAWIPTPPLAERARGWPIVELPVGPDTLVDGDVAGAIGHLLFLDEPDGRFALDLGSLKAMQIELDPIGGKRPSVQLGLF